MKRRNIVIYSLKGGVGKTSLGINIAMNLKYGVITNDLYSPIDKVLPGGRYLKLKPGQDLPSKDKIKDRGILFDFGGYLDKRVRDAVDMSGLVIIPVMESDDLNIQGLLSAIGEVQKITQNIIIIFNKVTPEGNLLIRSLLKKANINYPIFGIKNSKSLQNVFREKRSVAEMVDEGGLNAYLYREVMGQIDAVILYIKKLFSK